MVNGSQAPARDGVAASALRLAVGMPTTPVATLSGGAYAELRRKIHTLELPPGHAFSETDACELLRMSKAPVRDALARLRREGLVVSAARSGYTVAPMTVKDARDLLGLRTLFEGASAALAAAQRGDLDRLRELDELCQMHYDPSDPDSVHRFLSANSAFHVAVAELAGNQRLVDQLARVIDQLERYMHLGLRLASHADEIVHEHRDLVAAIATGDARRARRLAEQQAHDSHRMVVDGLLSSEVVLTANIGSSLGEGD